MTIAGDDKISPSLYSTFQIFVKGESPGI
jgi:hypothetical protein